MSPPQFVFLKKTRKIARGSAHLYGFPFDGKKKKEEETKQNQPLSLTNKNLKGENNDKK